MRFLAAWLALGLGLAATLFAAPTTLQLTLGEYRPMLSEDLPGGGPVSAMVHETFELAGIDVSFGFFPWPRALELARTGEWDGTVFWVKTPEREQDFYFSHQPLLEGTVRLFALKTLTSPPTSLADLARFRVATTRGYSYGKEFDDLRAAGRFETEDATNDATNFRKLLAGRVDLVVCSVRVATALLDTQFSAAEAQKVVPSLLIAEQAGAYLLLSKRLVNARHYMDDFDAAWVQFVQTPQHERLLRALVVPPPRAPSATRP